MKIYKEREHSLMLKPFGLLGKQYLGLTVYLYFDLTAPSGLLREQNLWREVPPQLGGEGVLDMGMPKSQAEFLVQGACHAPRDTQVQASQVTVRIGNLQKTLYVFGDRYWNRMGAISAPEPFSKIPLTFANAYGGPEYPQNPLGMGYKLKKDVGKDKFRVPLPHVENPKQLIGSLSYHPQPASFQPINVMWPQRHQKSGSYDEAWLKQRWPDMPDDTHPTFFNTAAPDQWQEAWFSGDESIDILHMHPDMQHISSRLPGKRIRAFLTMYKDFKYFKKKEELCTEFREVETHIDTVLLFPEILRGVVLYRGSVASTDDEYYDVVNAFIQTEKLTDPPESLEYYHKELQKRLNPSLPVDFAPFEADGKEMSKTLLNLRNLPKKLDKIGKSVLGKEPVMPRSPNELADMAQKTIAGHLQTLDELESMTKSLHANFGHKDHFDLDQFETKRQELLQDQKNVIKMGREAQSSQDDLLAMNKKLVSQSNALVQDVYSPEALAKIGVTEAQAREAGVPYKGLDFPDDTGNPFHDRGFPLVVEARKRLENDPRVLDRLKRLGLEQETIEYAWLGLLPAEREEQLQAWGLKPNAPDDQRFVLPRGLLMPRFDDAVLNRVMVRTDLKDLPQTDKDADLPGTQESPARENVTPGSDNTPLALYAAVEDTHWVRVADELQALYVEQEVGDACGVISLVAPTEKPDPDTEKAIKAAGMFLCLMPQGTKAESEVWKNWVKAFPNARLLALPQGETVFQTTLAGHDIRKLILDALPEDFAKEHSVEFTFSKELDNLGVEFPNLKFPKVDIGAKIDSWHKQATDAFAPMAQELDANADKGFANLDDLSKKASGLHFIKAENPPDQAGPKALIDDYRRLIGEAKAGLVGTPYLPPEKIAVFDKADATLAGAAKKFTALEARGQSLLTELDTREKEMDQLLATNCIPGMTPDEMREAGLDPAKGAPMTREQVIAMLERHESFVERNFDGTDLSGLDMSGVDMSKSVLMEANLKETRLEGANFNKTIFHKCDLTKAWFQDATFRLSVFDGCKMPETNFRNAKWDKNCCKDSDLTGADLSDANIQLAIVQKCKLQNANCSNSSVRLAVFDSSDASGVLFRNARMQKGMIKDCCLDNADFSGATVNRIMFHGSKGKKVCFAGADMSHGRMTGNTQLPGADFQGACLDASSFRETNLSGAHFKDATLNQTLFELCDLTRAKLRLVKAHGARLLKTNFEGADMAGMDLFMGSLRKSRLVDTNLTAANLYSTDLFKSVMHNTRLDRANLKRTLIHRREEYIG